MPTSTSIFKEQTIEYICKYINTESNIIDIGAGAGTYYNTLYPLGYRNIDAVEVFEKYISQFNLKDKYRNVFNQNVISLDIDLTKYQLAIFGDVIEHISYVDAINTLDKFNNTCEDIIVGVPFNAEQDAQFGNQYEIHIQSDLNNEKFLSLYRDFELYCLRYDYGIYIKKKTANSYVPIYTLDITEEDKDFLANYSNRAIIEI
jgi:phospholipid N-methyltransferase|tara:strand:+ start:334 stop:942 length:609 start_codon:yes stop_codon:yes gene_type:complete